MSQEFDVNLRMTDLQAVCVAAACWMYTRISSGHLETILEWVRLGLIPMRREATEMRAAVGPTEHAVIRRQIIEIKRLLGHRPDMLSGLDLRHPHTHASVHDAWDIRQAIVPWLQDPQTTEVSVTMTAAQAAAVSAACDLYTRICMGQIEEIVELVRLGVLPAARPESDERARVSYEAVEKIDEHVSVIKRSLGHHPNSSLGVGHPHVDLTAKRAWEAKKAIDKALAEHRDPNPAFKGVNYDGNDLRYTDDPVPVVTIQDKSPTPAP